MLDTLQPPARIVSLAQTLHNDDVPLISAIARLCTHMHIFHSEVVKAVLGYLRVAVGGADRAVLEPLLPEIVSGIMTRTPRAVRLYLRAKTKVVLAKLCRKFGFERVKVYIYFEFVNVLEFVVAVIRSVVCASLVVVNVGSVHLQFCCCQSL
jgi:hypothetical protein